MNATATHHHWYQVLVQFETSKMARQAAHNYQGLKALGAASLDVKHLKSDNYMRF